MFAGGAILRTSLAFATILILAVLAGQGGCASGGGATTQQTMSERQDQAINDPMGYKPPDVRSVDGGSAGTFDKKAMSQDFNDLLNP